MHIPLASKTGARDAEAVPWARVRQIADALGRFPIGKRSGCDRDRRKGRRRPVTAAAPRWHGMCFPPWWNLRNHKRLEEP